MGDADAPGAAEGDGDQAERDRQAVAAQQRRAPQAREALQHHRVNASLDQFNRLVGQRDRDQDRHREDKGRRRVGEGRRKAWHERRREARCIPGE